MNNELSKPGAGGVQRWLDKDEVLRSTVEQLRKDLSMSVEDLPIPAISGETFEVLRSAVLPTLQNLQRKGTSTLQVAMYRVDIPEAFLVHTLQHGGLHALAGECVLRALQKVLTRLRYAGRF